VLQLLYIFILQISLKTLGEIQPKNYKVGHNLAENCKSRQNVANLNVSRGFIFEKNSAWKSALTAERK